MTKLSKPLSNGGLSTILIRNPDTDLLKKSIKDILDKSMTITKKM